VVLETLQGDVDVKRGAGSWEAGQSGMKLSPGDMVATGFASEAKLRFEDNSFVTVRPLTQMTIDRFLKDSAAVRTDIAVKVGEIKAQVEHGKGIKSDFVVITPTSVVSVRGTDEDLNVSDKGTDVVMNECTVRGENEQGQPSRVSAGQEAQFKEGELPVTPVDNAIERARADTTSGFGLSRKEEDIAHEFSDPTLDPGLAAVGQKSSTDEEEGEAPPEQQQQTH
jgi:hypothetical protein